MATYTTFYNLYKPSVKERGWGNLVNANFDTIDTALHDMTGGGHEIQDDGVSRPQEDRLNFLGVVVTDNPGNTSTDVDIRPDYYIIPASTYHQLASLAALLDDIYATQAGLRLNMTTGYGFGGFGANPFGA